MATKKKTEASRATLQPQPAVEALTHAPTTEAGSPPIAVCFVVCGSSGEYDDYRTWPVIVCPDQESADGESARLLATARALEARYQAAWQRYIDSSDDDGAYDRCERVRKRLTGSNGDENFDPANGPTNYSVEPVRLW